MLVGGVRMSDSIIKVRNLKKWFPVKRSIKDFVKGKPKEYVRAVDGISFDIKRGEIFGLIGESGCGKTTTGKLIMKLLEPTDGKMIFNEEDVTHLDKDELFEYKKKVQMIFQDPYASMNPRFKIRDVLFEPLIIHHPRTTLAEMYNKSIKALDEVKVSPPEEFIGRYPHMLSGGQRQRIATARTLILNPKMVVADEPVSMVDLSTRAELLAMMREVQREHNLTYLYITHDLSTARYFTDRIAVMYLGKIVEIGDGKNIDSKPKHADTKGVFKFVPVRAPEMGI